MALAPLMDNMDESSKNAFCLIAAPCFVNSIDTFANYESSLIGIQWDNINEVYDDFKFSTALIMMAIDIVLYLVLAIYFDNVWPSRYGQRKPLTYICSPRYWRCTKRSENNMEFINDTKPLDYSKLDKYEEINSMQRPLIKIRNLVKTFNTGLLPNSRKVKAVQGVNLDMYAGETFCLLGHNGAGKTTTISMLTGLLDCTQGNAYIDGFSMKDEMSEIRKNLGICFQHDVLYKDLSAREHLWLFARLKGVPQERVMSEIDIIVKNGGLDVNNLENKYPRGMSGGEKRKLSLAIALIGGSKICFLGIKLYIYIYIYIYLFINIDI